MKNRFFLFFTSVLFLVAAMAATSLIAEPSEAGCANDGDPGCPPMMQVFPLFPSIAPEHKACQQDVDCKVIEIGCMGCGVTRGGYDAVNKLHFSHYSHLSNNCTPAEIRTMQTTECEFIKSPIAVCLNHQCGVEWRPVQR